MRLVQRVCPDGTNLVTFIVAKPSRHLGTYPRGALVLVQDNWNDFGYHTQYHLYASTDEGVQQVGTVKILRRGQTAADPLQIQGDFERLSDEYVSVGESLDYYTRLTELLPGR